MFWNATNLQWGAIATQWDATFLVENTAVADEWSITVTTAELILPGLVLCGDTLNASMLGALSSLEGVSASDTVGVTAATTLSSAESASLLATESAASSLLVNVGESVGSADSTSVAVVANPGISETLAMSVSDTVSAKMLTGLNSWAGAGSLWSDRTHAWNVQLSSIVEGVFAYDYAGDLTETTDYLLESVQLSDAITINCNASVGSAESIYADFTGLASAAVALTISETGAMLSEFQDKSPRKKYEYDSRTDASWRYDDGWHNDWNSSC